MSKKYKVNYEVEHNYHDDKSNVVLINECYHQPSYFVFNIVDVEIVKGGIRPDADSHVVAPCVSEYKHTADVCYREDFYGVQAPEPGYYLYVSRDREVHKGRIIERFKNHLTNN